LAAFRHRTEEHGRRKRKLAASVAVGVLLLLAGCGGDPPQPADTSTEQTEDGARADKGVRPVRVEIPKIGVDAKVIKLGLNPDRTLEVPKDFQETGWWSGGYRPGAKGPALITGHVDSRSGPAIFYRLRELEKGDMVRVKGANGRVVSFKITASERVDKDSFPTKKVYGKTKRSTLRLVTCDGAFDSSIGHYEDNLIFYATRVS
jgi:LPXTG-site transpeptidase (sortase) family protein